MLKALCFCVLAVLVFSLFWEFEFKFFDLNFKDFCANLSKNENLRKKINSQKSTKSFSDLPPLEIGDIIFRKGIGADSLAIEKLSKHPYTHIGIVVGVEPIEILHATTDDNPSLENQVILSTFDEFAKNAENIALKRYKLSEKMRKDLLLRMKEFLGRKFVLSADSGALYCTTLLEALLLPYISLNLAYEQVEIPVFRGKYLFPKAFYEDKNSILIYEK